MWFQFTEGNHFAGIARAKINIDTSPSFHGSSRLLGENTMNKQLQRGVTSAGVMYQSYEGTWKKHLAKSEEGMLGREGFLEKMTLRPQSEMKKYLLAK